jgi:hypothetical protein
LFKSSEVEERRQLIKLVPQNPRVEDKNVVFDLQKTFDTILKYADRKLWLPLVDVFRNRKVEVGIDLSKLENIFEAFNLSPLATTITV